MQKYLTIFKKIAGFFKKNPEDDRSWTEKLRDKYRLVVMNDETFEEISSFKLTPLNVYTIVSSLMVGTAIAITLLIIYTPLKRYIPGYGDFNRDSEIAELMSKTKDLENEVEATRRYSDNLRKILTGDHSGMSKEEVANQTSDSKSNIDSVPNELIERIPEDSDLRNAVATGNVTNNYNNVSNETSRMRELPLEQLFFIPPVSGETTAGFDLKIDHYGIDVAAPQNTAVKAAAAGSVIFAGYTVETGYSIAIQHPNNVITLYKHNSILLKTTGEIVRSGEAIAIIGNTGESSTGPHLHFELWHKGRPINPTDYIIFK